MKRAGPELEIQRGIVQWLYAAGALTFQIGGARRSGRSSSWRSTAQPGTPDILAVLPKALGCGHGRFLAVEVKGPGGKLTALQRANLEDVARRGGIAVEARSIDDVIDAIQANQLRV